MKIFFRSIDETDLSDAKFTLVNSIEVDEFRIGKNYNGIAIGYDTGNQNRIDIEFTYKEFEAFIAQINAYHKQTTST